MSETSRRAGIRGVRTETLKTVFVATMGVIFLVEFAGHFLDLFGLGDAIQFVIVLVATEVPLWFAQILLWSRGETIFERYEPMMLRSIETLERLGFTVEFFAPALDALKEEASRMTPEDREKLQAAIFAVTRVSLDKWRQNMSKIDPEKIALVMKRRLEAQAKWLEGADTPTGTP